MFNLKKYYLRTLKVKARNMKQQLKCWALEFAFTLEVQIPRKEIFRLYLYWRNYEEKKIKITKKEQENKKEASHFFPFVWIKENRKSEKWFLIRKVSKYDYISLLFLILLDWIRLYFFFPP